MFAFMQQKSDILTLISDINCSDWSADSQGGGGEQVNKSTFPNKYKL